MPKVYLACKSGATAETGHTFCMDCLKGLGLEEQGGHLANYFFPCPMCRQEIVHAIQSPAEFCFLIDGVGEKKSESHGTQLEGRELSPRASLQPSPLGSSARSQRETHDRRKRRKLANRRDPVNKKKSNKGQDRWEVTGVEGVRIIDRCSQVKVSWASTWISIDSFNDGQLKEIAKGRLGNVPRKEYNSVE